MIDSIKVFCDFFMKIIKKDSFIVILIGILVIVFLQTPILQALEFDLTAAQNTVGKRFASKFCEAKEKGFSTESSSEFALNNTYLKFVAFPEDERFIEDLWEFTRAIIRTDCGQYVNEEEEIILRDFFKEEGEIASKRDLYLPD